MKRLHWTVMGNIKGKCWYANIPGYDVPSLTGYINYVGERFYTISLSIDDMNAGYGYEIFLYRELSFLGAKRRFRRSCMAFLETVAKLKEEE